MLLTDWLRSERMSPAELARKMNVHPDSVARWIKGHEPKARYMERLSRLSKKAISFDDFQIKPVRKDPGRITSVRSVSLSELLSV